MYIYLRITREKGKYIGFLPLLGREGVGGYGERGIFIFNELNGVWMK